MLIRKATYHDAPFIKLMLQELGYKTSNSLLVDQLMRLFTGTDHEVLVCEQQKAVTGFAVVHVLPQLGLEGGLLIISYLSVDERAKDLGVARALESHITDMARKRQCEGIQVHCAEWRAQAQRLLLSQGYEEYPRYFIKRLKCPD